MNELISVVITTHERQAAILKEAIDSVLSQDYSNIELIVVNDAPNYNKRKEIDELVGGYQPKVKYVINTKGGGANASRNLGASIATGEYLSFLDDDDYWRTDRLRIVANELNKGFDIAYHDIIMFDEKSQRRINRHQIPHEETLESILKSNDWGGFSSVTIRRLAFNSVGGLDEGVKSQQDTDLWIRLAQKYQAIYINEPLTYYRVSDDAISVNEQKKIDGLYYLFDKYHDLYEKYPDSKKIKLRDELILFLKNGWKFGSNKLFSDLKGNYGLAYAVCIYFIGMLKNVANTIR